MQIHSALCLVAVSFLLTNRCEFFFSCCSFPPVPLSRLRSLGHVSVVQFPYPVHALVKLIPTCSTCPTCSRPVLLACLITDLVVFVLLLLLLLVFSFYVCLLFFLSSVAYGFQELDQYRDSYGRLVVIPPTGYPAGDRQHGRHGVRGAHRILQRHRVRVSCNRQVDKHRTRLLMKWSSSMSENKNTNDLPSFFVPDPNNV